MRAHVAEGLVEGVARGDELLSTGEVARLLSVSRQHVVDLTKRGDLDSILVGTHRRIRRADAELLAAGSRRLTRDQTRSLLLAHAMAGEIVKDPETARAIARKNLARMHAGSARGGARVWIAEWERLIDGSIVDVVAALTSPSPRSRELRQLHPFAGLLTDSDRKQVLAAASAPRGARG